MFNHPIACSACIVLILSLLLIRVVYIFRCKDKKDEEEINNVQDDDEIDWELNMN